MITLTDIVSQFWTQNTETINLSSLEYKHTVTVMPNNLVRLIM